MMVALSCCPRLRKGLKVRRCNVYVLRLNRVATSTGVRWKLLSLAGSSQIRMEYWAPKIDSRRSAVRLKGSAHSMR